MIQQSLLLRNDRYNSMNNTNTNTNNNLKNTNDTLTTIYKHNTKISNNSLIDTTNTTNCINNSNITKNNNNNNSNNIKIINNNNNNNNSNNNNYNNNPISCNTMMPNGKYHEKDSNNKSYNTNNNNNNIILRSNERTNPGRCSHFSTILNILSHAAVALIAYQLGVTTVVVHSEYKNEQALLLDCKTRVRFESLYVPSAVTPTVTSSSTESFRRTESTNVTNDPVRDSSIDCFCSCEKENQISDQHDKESVLPLQQQKSTTLSASSVHVGETGNLYQPQHHEHAESIRSLFTNAARVTRTDFIQQFDLGVPWDEKVLGAEDVLVFYSSTNAMPSSNASQTAATAASGSSTVSGWPQTHYESATEATSNCDIMKVLLVSPNQKKVKECVAIVPQWESYHVHKFMRWKDDKDYSKRNIPSVSITNTLKHVSRHHEKNGAVPKIPNDRQVQRYLPMLADYITKMSSTLDKLKPILDDMMSTSKLHHVNQRRRRQRGPGVTTTTNNNEPVVVMVCNFGQSELFLNFVCSAKARGIDLSRVLLFATDSDMYDVAKGIEGIHTFHVDKAFGETMPKDAAKQYGDRAFTGMMFSKLYCVQLVNALGYDVLFQDVDVVWYQDPIHYFTNTSLSGNYDFYFQDDGARTNRYTPYSPNSGFYYVRNNFRTKHFFSVFLRIADQIIVAASHQAVLNDLLTEQSSSTGLRIKTFARDNPIGTAFPGGYHYHNRRSFMKNFIIGKEKPYLFHMSWTKNKENKKKFMEQMGDWFVKETCVGKNITDIMYAQQQQQQQQYTKENDQPKNSNNNNNITTFLSLFQSSTTTTTTTKAVGTEAVNVISTFCCSVQPILVCHYSDKPSKYPCTDSPKIDRTGRSFW